MGSLCDSQGRVEDPGHSVNTAHQVSFQLVTSDLPLTCRVVAHQSPEDRLEIQWNPLGFYAGVTVRRRIAGNWYEWRVPANGFVNQAMATHLSA